MFDTETDGLYGAVTLAQFYKSDWNTVLIVEDPDTDELIKLLDTQRVVMHNAHYDITTIRKHSFSPDWIPENFQDTFLLSRLHWFREASFSLDSVMKYALGFDPYEAQKLDKKTLQKSKWKSGKLIDEQMIYAATDVYYMPRVWNGCKDHVKNMNYKLDKQTLENCLVMQNKGFPVIEQRRSEMFEENQLAFEAMDMPINVNSYQQVRPYIGEEQSDGLALAAFEILGNERAGKVIKAKKYLKTNSFLKKFKSDDGRIYGKFSPSARSGRLTSKDQNLQQLPRNTKTVFGYSDSDDRVLVYADFSQLELRCACAVVGESKMEKLFRKGVDLHSFTAETIFGEVTKELRTIAKTCNFNLIYGGSARMLGSILIKTAGIDLKQEELIRLVNEWKSLWKSIAAWQQQGIADWDHGIAWKTPMRRRYVGKQMTDQLNIQIQGAGADVAKWAFHKIMTSLKDVADAEVVNFIHDSYIIDCSDNPDTYEQVVDIVGTSMKQSWEEMSQYFTIKDLPNPVNVFVGKNWGEIEAEKNIIYSKEF